MVFLTYTENGHSVPQAKRQQPGSIVTGQAVREGFRTQKIENMRNGDREFVSL